jgi:hypothetical protein
VKRKNNRSEQPETIHKNSFSEFEIAKELFLKGIDDEIIRKICFK